MKPLSERIKNFQDEQFIDWLCLACVDVREVRTEEDAQDEINKIRQAVTDRFAALGQRAEVAEADSARWKEEAIKAHEESEIVAAKLAELAKQPAFGYADPKAVERMLKGYTRFYTVKPERSERNRLPIFISPAPAVSLAELVQLVPDAVGIHDMDPDSKDIEVVTSIAQCEGWNACRASILRNIENSK